jgi:hypothetical protein
MAMLKDQVIDATENDFEEEHLKCIYVLAPADSPAWSCQHAHRVDCAWLVAH